MNNENENKRLMGRMEAEIASLTEAKAAIEKAEEAVRKAGTVCEWLYGHAEEKFTLKNMAQKYEAEISQRAKLSSAAECLLNLLTVSCYSRFYIVFLISYFYAFIASADSFLDI